MGDFLTCPTALFTRLPQQIIGYMLFLASIVLTHLGCPDKSVSKEARCHCCPHIQWYRCYCIICFIYYRRVRRTVPKFLKLVVTVAPVCPLFALCLPSNKEVQEIMLFT